MACKQLNLKQPQECQTYKSFNQHSMRTWLGSSLGEPVQTLLKPELKQP